MKKLEDIPKKQVFDVPDGYFDKLPGIIQSRVAERRTDARPVARYALRFALPAVLLLIIAGIFFYKPAVTSSTTETILASIATDDLVAYLDDSDITTEELLESVDLDQDDLDNIESEVYNLNLNDNEVDAILNEID